MAYSSILGGDRAPVQPSGKGADLLGPSDSSDSGSDSIGELGEDDLDSDSDRAGTGDRAGVEPQTAASGADILPDRVVRIGEGNSFGDGDVDQLADLDADEEGDDDEADGSAGGR
ncbi:MAG: hypothetical protein EOO25_03015 [Comamonadaceae bacterium]|nr:MAG: hypothetical protein EOO25_03015 [Comamonadaceae bacterium]